MPISWTIAFVLIATSVVAAFTAILFLAALQSRQRPRPISLFTATPEETVFLFDADVLVDASDSARDFLAAVSVPAAPWGRLCTLLAPHFPGFEAQMARLGDIRRLVLSGSGDHPMTLLAEWRSGLARITLTRHHDEGRTLSVDRLSYQALDQELLGLRGTLDTAPLLVWREGQGGAVTWANRAYITLTAAHDGQDRAETWPLPHLFDTGFAPLAEPGKSRRAKLQLPDEKKPSWFDCYCFPEADGTLHFALPADATVQAELALREFIQTLTKTFAHLPIGLAIFDRQRQLALFNPALIDLTGLGPEFLSARPTLFTFLDRLREEQRMPEPKNYKLWRQQMAALERAASSGQYEEIWSLPSGQTYRVTGRPHPDGAMALLLEDISAEMSLTRRFRAELEVGQSVIDSLSDAIAVFSPAGVLVLSNAAYTRLWGVDPCSTVGEIGIGEAARYWVQGSQPSAVWAKARDYIGAMAERAAWTGEVFLLDGRQLSCRLAPIQGGSTLVSFCLTEAAPAVLAGRRKPGLRRPRIPASHLAGALALVERSESL